MSNNVKSEVTDWIARINETYLKQRSIEENTKDLQSLIDSKEFVKFIWSNFSYWRANIYTFTQQGKFDCLHRNDQQKLDYQIRVPWLSIHKTKDGRLSPFEDKHSISIKLTDNPKRVSENYREKGEISLQNNADRKREKSTSQILCELMEKQKEQKDRSKKMYICITEGEILFFSLMTEPIIQYKFGEREIRLVVQWLKNNNGQSLLNKLVNRTSISEFADLLRNRKLKLSDQQIEMAWERSRINPAKEKSRLGSRNILFFPCDKIFTRNGLTTVYFLGSFYYKKRMIDNITSIIVLFSQLAGKGTDLYEQKKASEKEEEELKHHIGNLINNLKSQLSDTLDDANKIQTIRFITEHISGVYQDWKSPHREYKEIISVKKIFEEINKIKPYSVYPINIQANIDYNVFIQSDRKKMIRCLCELINNSRNAITSPNDHSSIKITASSSNIDQLVIIAEDTGNGLSKEKFEQVQSDFLYEQDRFHLGLRYVCSYIKHLDGSIDLVEKESPGTKLEILLPLFKEV